MIIGKVSLAKPHNNYAQKNFGQNRVNKFEVIRAFDDARLSPQAPVLEYKPEFMKTLSDNNRFQQNNLIIGITGESASGKTTLSKAIKDFAMQKGLSLSLMTCDNYYKDLSSYYKKYGGYAEALFAGENLESPESFDLVKMNSDLEKLKHGKTIKTPEFNFCTGVSTPNVHEVKPARFMILEGIVANNNAANDINIYVDCRDNVKLTRALARAEERGKTRETMLKMWKFVSESAQNHILPLREKADVILNGETNLKEFNIFMENLLKAFKK